MSVEPVNLLAARAFLRRKAQQRQARLDPRFAAAWDDFRRIVHLLVRDFAPRRIYQWGSLLHREQFTEWSDVDVALEGLGSAERLFAAYAAASNLTRFPLDLVEMEHIEPEFAHLIRLKGVVVYDRDSSDPGPHFRG